MSSLVLHVSANFHDRTVEDWFLPRGAMLQIGHPEGVVPRGARIVEVPVPEGTDWLARVLFKQDRWLVQEPDGTVREVTEGNRVELVSGEVRVVLATARRSPPRRFELPSVQGSLAWFSMVVMVTLFTAQYAWVGENLCPMATAYLPHVGEVGGPILWATLPMSGLGLALLALVVANEWRSVWPALLAPVVGVFVPLAWQLGGFHYASGDQFLQGELAFCLPQEQAANGGGAFTAEYLARLLRKDYAGEDKGVIEDHLDRPEAERELQKRQIFMPAGASGPVTRMGGAAERTLRPTRTLVVESEPVVPKQRKGERTPSEAGKVPTPAAAPADEVADGQDRGLEIDATSDAEDAENAPSEEVEGWGVPGWYDERDMELENLEIDVMLRIAKRRLRLDPDDLDALGVLSYYQYLAQDYKTALQTYDHILELYPDDAAGYNNKALVYKRMQDYRKEEGLYRKALSLEPMDETALNNLAVNLSHQGRFDEALAIMKDLEVIDPEDAYADLHRAKIHAEMGHDEEALRFLDQALAGMQRLDTLHHIEFRQDIRLDPSFARLRENPRFKQLLMRYYGKDSPLQEQ